VPGLIGAQSRGWSLAGGIGCYSSVAVGNGVQPWIPHRGTWVRAPARLYRNPLQRCISGYVEAGWATLLQSTLRDKDARRRSPLTRHAVKCHWKGRWSSNPATIKINGKAGYDVARRSGSKRIIAPNCASIDDKQIDPSQSKTCWLADLIDRVMKTDISGSSDETRTLRRAFEMPTLQSKPQKLLHSSCTG
jgi:hypothetical protein